MSDPRSLRIGDAERDAAVAELGEHYAAGRITKDEYDERTGKAWTAKFDDDLRQIFVDLPHRRVPSAPSLYGSSARAARRPDWSGPPMRVLWLLPLLMVAAGLAVAVKFGAPWVFLVFFAICIFRGFGHRRGYVRGRRL